jgi:hypothetical protein
VAEDAPVTAEQLAEQIRALKVADLLISTVATLGQLAYVKVEAKELDQARLAIDALGALTPLLEGHADPDMLRQLNQLLADVRITFASAATATEGLEASAAKPPTPGQKTGSPSAPRGRPNTVVTDRCYMYRRL